MMAGLLPRAGLRLPFCGLQAFAIPRTARAPGFFTHSHRWTLATPAPLAPSPTQSPILNALQRFLLNSRISRSDKFPVKKPQISKPPLSPSPTSRPSSATAQSRFSSGGGGGGGSELLILLQRYQSWLIIGGLIVINVAVFVAWQYAAMSWSSYNDPRPFIWMHNNFLAGLSNLEAGRWWTLITCAFSQNELGHFFLNMFTLTAMAPMMAQMVGAPSLLALYLGAGLCTSLTSIFWDQARQASEENKKVKMSHGASGANYAILTTFACLRPRLDLYLFFLLPVPAWLGMAGVFAWDFYQAAYAGGGKTDNAGHVGGILTGLAYFFFRLRGRGI